MPQLWAYVAAGIVTIQSWLLLAGVVGLAIILRSLTQAVRALEAQVLTMNADLQAKFDDLEAKVTAETTVEQSAVSLLRGLSAQIAELKTGVTDPAVLARIDALSAAVAATTTDLSNAVAANTPAA